MKPKVYLDIDGVILANENNLANYAHEFLERVVNGYDTFWLTTHCKGDAQQAVDRLSLVAPAETMELVKRIKPTNWEIAKTEALDLSSPFLVFEDDLYDDERAELIKHDALDNWILVDLATNENQLHDFLVSFPLPKSEFSPL